MTPPRTKHLTLLGLLLAACPSAFAAAPGTAFTYQGQLQSAGSPATGNFNMAFALWDAPTAGNQVSSTLYFNGAGSNPPPVAVAGGLFTVSLDFGADAFTGNALWLEVTVSGITLSPRQPLTGAPYSLTTRGLNVDPYGQVGIGTTTPGTPLQIVADGYGFQHVNPNQGSDLTTFVDDNGGWIGTVSDKPLLFFTHDSGAQMMLSTSGSLGIGTPDPQSRLHVAGNIQIDQNAHIQFGSANENTDPIWLSRFDKFSNSSNQSVLQLELGDDPGGTPTTNDAFIITANGQTLFQFNTQQTGGQAGQALKNGGGAWGVLSDARAKHDIKPLTGTLDRLLKLHGRTYYYNDPCAAGAGLGLQTGFVAQEAETVFPQWIGTLASGLKTLNITGFEAMTVEALRDLRTEKDRQIADRDARISALEHEVKQLKSLMQEIRTEQRKGHP